MHFVAIGGEKDDRRVGGAPALANKRRGLEAVHVRHVDVEENDGKVLVQQAPQGFAAGLGRDDVLPELLEHDFHGQKFFRQVVDNQNVCLVLNHRRPWLIQLWALACPGSGRFLARHFSDLAQH